MERVNWIADTKTLSALKHIPVIYPKSEKNQFNGSGDWVQTWKCHPDTDTNTNAGPKTMCLPSPLEGNIIIIIIVIIKY